MLTKNRVIASLLLGIAVCVPLAGTAAAASGGAVSASSTAMSAPAADPTPSPTLGVTETPRGDQPGDQDNNPSDVSRPWLVVVGALVFIVVAAIGSFLWLRGRRGTPQDQLPR